MELKKYRQVADELEGECRRLEELEARMQSVSSAPLSHTPHSRTEGDRMAMLIAQKEQQSERVRALERKCFDVEQEMETAFTELSSVERSIMRMRYIDGMDWKSIALTLDLSIRHAYRKHRNALKNLTIEK